MNLISVSIVLLFVATITARELNKFSRNGKCDCVCGVRGRGNRIVGGYEATPHEFPWTVGLFRQGKLYCGASLISENFLLTAAHCVDGISPVEIKAYFGGHNITKDYTEMRRIKKIHQHESFNIFSFDNDIALLELAKGIKFGPKVQPACLPDGSVREFSGSEGIVAGWGRLAEKQQTSMSLQTVTVPVWSREECATAGYGSKRITENMICSGYVEGGKDACQGDSGGSLGIPLPTGNIQIIGVVSWGRGCGRKNLPGIYTNVVNYLPWINRRLKNECLCSPRPLPKTFSDFVTFPDN
ncbi:trypsin 3A1-like [Culicoides brevitarsis]|uniref:trypsin 3A1-like n=1 Tax=Culicoides brevitarsis TaxID=469753 RepID=UPI00307C3E05